MSTEALKRAVEAAGGQAALARQIGVTQSVVWYWLERSKRGLPAEHVSAVEAASGISRHELRPDLYPPPAVTPVSASPKQEHAA